MIQKQYDCNTFLTHSPLALPYHTMIVYFTRLKLQAAIFPLSQHVIRFHELPDNTTQRFL